MGFRRFRRAGVFALASLLAPAGTSAQTELTEQVEMAPIICRWRTGATAVRVAEPFSVVLTCSVTETVSTTVVPDRSRLDPSVIDLQPFEVVGGRAGLDIQAAGTRTFQYEYDVRYFGELFDVDVSVPELTLTYRVQSRLESGELIEGREREYALPPLAMRILSLVPDTADDIREVPPATFAEVDARRFRAQLYETGGLGLLVLGVITAAWALVGVTRRQQGTGPTPPRLASDATILRAAANQLATIRRRRHAEGWSGDLAAGALAALRVAATVETGRALAQVEAPPTGEPSDGRLAVRTFPSRRLVWASGSSTHAAVEAERTRRAAAGRDDTARLDRLGRLMGVVTAAVYARPDTAPPEPAALDEALDDGETILRALAREHVWLVRLTHQAGQAARRAGRRVWAR